MPLLIKSVGNVWNMLIHYIVAGKPEDKSTPVPAPMPPRHQLFPYYYPQNSPFGNRSRRKQQRLEENKNELEEKNYMDKERAEKLLKQKALLVVIRKDYAEKGPQDSSLKFMLEWIRRTKLEIGGNLWQLTSASTPLLLPNSIPSQSQQLSTTNLPISKWISRQVSSWSACKETLPPLVKFYDKNDFNLILRNAKIFNLSVQTFGEPPKVMTVGPTTVENILKVLLSVRPPPPPPPPKSQLPPLTPSPYHPPPLLPSP